MKPTTHNHSSAPVASAPVASAHVSAEDAELAKLLGEDPSTAPADAVQTPSAETPSADAPADETGKKRSTKTREARQVPEGFSTTWVPINVTDEDALMLRHAAKVGKTTIAEMLSKLLAPAYTSLRNDLQAEAAKFAPKVRATLPKLETDDDVTAAKSKIDAQKARLEAAQAKLDAAIAARQAKNNNAVQNAD